MGFIVRTAGIDRTKRDLQRDLNYLSRLWKRVATRIKKVPAPASLYKESDLVIRTIRDVYDTGLKKVIVDSEAVGARVSDFLSIASPRSTDVVEIYDGDEPLFHRYGIEKEITQLYSKNVPLPCGGSLVIEQTEAMVAVDVNSGKFRLHDDAEETSYHVNCEAVDELARQLRLRDLGGLVVVDLIDMEIYQASGDLGLSLDGDQSTAGNGAAGGAIRGYNTGGTSTFFLTADESGNGSALLTMGDRFNTTVRVTANGNGGGGGINLYNDSGIETAQLDGDADDAGELILFDATGVGTLLADGDDGVSGARFSIGNGARESMRFDAGVANGHPEIRIWRGNDSEIFRLNGSGANGDPDMYLRDASGTTAVSMP